MRINDANWDCHLCYESNISEGCNPSTSSCPHTTKRILYRVVHNSANSNYCPLQALLQLTVINRPTIAA